MIAVLGATGRIGRSVAAALADGSNDACALTRSTAEVPLAARHADLKDAATVRQALRGVTRLFLVTPHGPDQDLLEATAIDAARDAGVQHVVKISGGAASLGPNGTTSTAVAHWRSEQRIEQSGMGFTFLRPSYFQQNLLEFAPAVAKTGLLLAPFGRAPIAMVDVRDIAACAVAVLLDPEPASGAWQVTGPRGVTLDDIAAHFGARHVPVPLKLVASALARRGATPHEVDHALRMASYFAAGSDGAPTNHVQQLTGRAPRSVEAFLDEHRSDFNLATGLARALSRTPSERAV